MICSGLPKFPFSRLLFASILTCSITAAGAQVTPVATGLNNPRGLLFGPDDTLYVAEAGLGAGNGFGGVGTGVGLTGSIGKIEHLESHHPEYERIVTGLSSVADQHGVVGADGLSQYDDGELHFIMAESGLAEQLNYPNSSPTIFQQFGRLFAVSGDHHTPIAIAKVGNFDYKWSAANKNAPFAPVGQFPDANPYAVLSVPGYDYIADAGSNTIDEVDSTGKVRIVAYVPNPTLTMGSKTVTISDAVPTCIAKGDDGYLYVGTLAFGAFYASHTPQSKIYRVDPKLSNALLNGEDVWASGFNPITGCGFSHHAFYVTEFITAASGGMTGDVVRISLTDDGAAGKRKAFGVGKLVTPNGFAAGEDGAIYVSNFSVFPGVNSGPTGQVVRINTDTDDQDEH